MIRTLIYRHLSLCTSSTGTDVYPYFSNKYSEAVMEWAVWTYTDVLLPMSSSWPLITAPFTLLHKRILSWVCPPVRLTSINCINNWFDSVKISSDTETGWLVTDYRAARIANLGFFTIWNPNLSGSVVNQYSFTLHWRTFMSTQWLLIPEMHLTCTQVLYM